ncbi:precorrin-6A synthase (deacetylating) [Calidifontibacter terrae]
MTIEIIGIGCGSPGHLTADAIAALRGVDVFLVADKGDVKSELVSLRRSVLEHHRPEGGYRFIAVADPTRAATGDYGAAVLDWHTARAEAYEAVIAGLPADTTIGFLVWGDPAFYDSTIRIVDRIGLPFKVFPGISAVQLLAAEHRIVLHDIGKPVVITTGRRLAEDLSSTGTTVVMLDGGLACQSLLGRGLAIHWGAYLGMAQQELRSGLLDDVIEELIELRARLRAEHGWVMDVYALS